MEEQRIDVHCVQIANRGRARSAGRSSMAKGGEKHYSWQGRITLTLLILKENIDTGVLGERKSRFPRSVGTPWGPHRDEYGWTKRLA